MRACLFYIKAERFSNSELLPTKFETVGTKFVYNVVCSVVRINITTTFSLNLRKWLQMSVTKKKPLEHSLVRLFIYLVFYLTSDPFTSSDNIALSVFSCRWLPPQYQLSCDQLDSIGDSYITWIIRLPKREDYLQFLMIISSIF